jgi:TetR/AcrR family transcriptional regulator
LLQLSRQYFGESKVFLDRDKVFERIDHIVKNETLKGMNNMAINNIKNLILSAAGKEFLARGYSGARMQAIADKAGINKALLHYHFSSKEKLYNAVLRDQFASFIESLIELFLREEDLEPWLRRLIARLLREFSARPQFSRFIIWELNSQGKELPRIFAEVLAQSEEGTF